MDHSASNAKTSILHSQKVSHLIAGIGIFGLLGALSVVNYPLFHTLAELFSIILACSIFIMAWNARRILDDSFVLFIGIAFLFVALTDLMHTLAQPWMGLLGFHTCDAAAQFWVAARHTQALSLLAAPLFIGRRVRARLLLSGYFVLLVAVVTTTLSCCPFALSITEHGLTSLRIRHEAVVCAVFLAAGVMLIRSRRRIDSNVYRLILWAIWLAIGGEAALVLHVDPYVVSNLIGHFLKISSFYLVYKAIVEIGLRQPYDLIFHNLKRREEMILESERRYRGIVEDQTDLICRFKADGTITFVNDAYCRYFGKAQREVIGEKFTPQIPEEDRSKVRALIASLDRDNPVATIEHRVVGPDGSIRWQQWTDRIVFDQEDDSVEYQGVGRDITARKQSEEALQDSERWRAVGALAGGAAHSFNSIMSVISGSAASIADSVLPRTRAHDEALRILEATHRAGELTRRLMSAATAGVSADQTRIEAVSLQNVLQDARDLVLQKLKEGGASFKMEPPAPSLYVRAASEQLLEIFVGLFLNASDAMPDGGTITVQVSERRIRRVAVRASSDARPGQYIAISVHDTGAGMTRETQAHIFDAGFTTKQDGFAFGLGLSVARRMVRSFGGWITVRSRPGAGTAFHVFLLKTAAPAGVAVTPEGALTGRTILVIDDKPDILSLATDTLQKAGHRVLTADTAKSAMLLYREYAHETALVIVDLFMPSSNGKSLIEDILPAEPRTAILVTSGFSREFARGQIPPGAWSFLQKPFTPEELLDAVQNCLTSARSDKSRAIPAL
jgi:PAS domain S-box-containing protein